MPEYRYTVVDAGGKVLSGNIDAENEDVCRRIISQRGLYCLSLDPASLGSRSISFEGRPRLKPKEVSVFSRQLATMLSAGVGVVKGLDILHSQSQRPAVKTVVRNVYEGVQRGQAFSSALRMQEDAFPSLLINMAEAGEVSGTLDVVMRRVADNLEKDVKTANKVRGALVYPAVLAGMTVAVVLLLMVFVLPTFIGLFAAAGAELPLPTRMLIAISNSITGYWYLYLSGIAALWLAVLNYLKSKTGRYNWDKLKMTLPVFGKLNLTVVSARFARTLSILMQSGIPMLRSLEVVGKVLGNRYIEQKIEQVREEVRQGMALSSAMGRAGVFPPMLLSMISIGEESGTLDQALEKTAALYDEEADSAVARMIGLLEPMLIVVMAIVVGFIVVAIMLPLYGMMQNIH